MPFVLCPFSLMNMMETSKILKERLTGLKGKVKEFLVQTGGTKLHIFVVLKQTRVCKGNHPQIG